MSIFGKVQERRHVYQAKGLLRMVRQGQGEEAAARALKIDAGLLRQWQRDEAYRQAVDEAKYLFETLGPPADLLVNTAEVFKSLSRRERTEHPHQDVFDELAQEALGAQSQGDGIRARTGVTLIPKHERKA
jgi:hypothetical protein